MIVLGIILLIILYFVFKPKKEVDETEEEKKKEIETITQAAARTFIETKNPLDDL